MIKSKTALLGVISLVIVIGVFVAANAISEKRSERTLFVAPEQYQKSFAKSVEEASSFYDLYGQALDAAEAQNYDEAVDLFHRCLPLAKFGPEKGMVYYRLALMAKATGDFESEIRYRESIARYSANPELTQRSIERAAELRRLLAAKASQEKAASGSSYSSE